MEGCKLREANLGQADLASANLGRADLAQANLKQANLGGANVEQASLIQVNLQEANLQNLFNMTLFQLSKARSLRQARLDAPVYAQLAEEYPHVCGEN
ncbi:MAG: pentapeptide repeat-containing protein [Nitrospira sp.]|nr:pentapeptide repeat-containing protein [Nitrospira sp.]